MGIECSKWVWWGGVVVVGWWGEKLQPADDIFSSYCHNQTITDNLAMIP